MDSAIYSSLRLVATIAASARLRHFFLAGQRSRRHCEQHTPPRVLDLSLMSSDLHHRFSPFPYCGILPLPFLDLCGSPPALPLHCAPTRTPTCLLVPALYRAPGLFAATHSCGLYAHCTIRGHRLAAVWFVFAARGDLRTPDTRLARFAPFWDWLAVRHTHLSIFMHGFAAYFLLDFCSCTAFTARSRYFLLAGTTNTIAVFVTAATRTVCVFGLALHRRISLRTLARLPPHRTPAPQRHLGLLVHLRRLTLCRAAVFWTLHWDFSPCARCTLTRIASLHTFTLFTACVHRFPPRLAVPACFSGPPLHHLS